MKLRELTAMSPEQKREAVRKLARAAMGPANGEVASLDRRLREYERRYEMSTAKMLAQFRAGKVRDTADVARWMVLAKARGG